MEFETEANIYEDFSSYSNEDKLELIRAIVGGEEWEFIGETIVCIEPPDRY
jgi:hypothetical protein